MGHTEMLLAVAGLDQDEIAERCRKLAEGDWSQIPPGQRTALVFAHKQAKTPCDINDEDVQRLVDHFGTERALDVIWWSCRCHFMTRVADGFQLPLERDNVFQTPKPVAEPAGSETESKPDSKK
jgi:alkylhydroperoxidase family enzyme